MQKHNLPLKVSQRIIDFADREAIRLGISRSEVIRRILDNHVDDHTESVVDVSEQLKDAVSKNFISKNDLIQILLAFKNDYDRAAKYFLFERREDLSSKLTSYLTEK